MTKPYTITMYQRQDLEEPLTISSPDLLSCMKSLRCWVREHKCESCVRDGIMITSDEPGPRVISPHVLYYDELREGWSVRSGHKVFDDYGSYEQVLAWWLIGVLLVLPGVTFKVRGAIMDAMGLIESLDSSDV